MRSQYLLVIALFACGSDSAPPAIDAPATADAPIDAPASINGCMPSTAVDRSAPGAARMIQISDDFYTPRCTRIAVGQSVTWLGDFGEHPLAPGILRGSSVITQPGSPITSVTNGATTTIAFPAQGEWAYYCPNHSPNMSGVIYVVP